MIAFERRSLRPIRRLQGDNSTDNCALGNASLRRSVAILLISEIVPIQFAADSRELSRRREGTMAAAAERYISGEDSQLQDTRRKYTTNV